MFAGADKGVLIINRFKMVQFNFTHIEQADIFFHFVRYSLVALVNTTRKTSLHNRFLMSSFVFISISIEIVLIEFRNIHS